MNFTVDYSGQVWESDEEGCFIVLREEVFNDMNVLVLLKVERGTIAYLPKYVIYANDICRDEFSCVWRRVA